MVAIQVDGLKKVFSVRESKPGFLQTVKGIFSPQFKKVEALSGISFSLDAGERVAFIGPNGAGKSTTIKILSGILHPSSGRANVLGFVPWENRKPLCYQIGTVFGQRTQLWYHLPPSDSFDLLARVYDLTPTSYSNRRKALVDVFGIGKYLNKPVRQLSLGQRMRCEVVASLLHCPKILFLDEPTIGLDVTAKATIRDLIKERALKDETTILLTSHDTGDMERVCRRVIVINEGKLLLDQPLRALRREFIKKKIITLLTAAKSITVEMPGVKVVKSTPHRTKLEVDLGKTAVDEVVQNVMKVSRLRDITIEDPPMEDIIKKIYTTPEVFQ